MDECLSTCEPVSVPTRAGVTGPSLSSDTTHLWELVLTHTQTQIWLVSYPLLFKRTLELTGLSAFDNVRLRNVRSRQLQGGWS